MATVNLSTVVKLNLIGSTTPTVGTYNVGDIIWDAAPTAGGFIGRVCTTAGTPGTWTGFGKVGTTAVPNVLDYGASATDAISNAAQKAAFDAAWAASPSGMIYVPAGTYSFGTLRFAVSATRKGIIGDGPGKTIIQYTSAADASYLFWMAGTGPTGGNKTLSQNALEFEDNAGSNGWLPIVKTSAAHGFAVEDWIMVASAAAWPYTVEGALKGEIARVAVLGDAAGANTTTAVMLGAKLHDNYNTADTAYAVKLSMMTNLYFRDFSVVCTNPRVSSNSTSVFLTQYCENVRFQNIDFYGVDEQCIESWNTINARVDNCHGRLLGHSGASGEWQGTLVLTRVACQDWIVNGCSMYQGWHLFTTGGAAQAGVSRNILIANCWAAAGGVPAGASQQGGAPFDTHGEGDGVHFYNCQVLGSNRYGFSSRSPRTHFINCVTDGSTELGFWIGRDNSPDGVMIGCRALNLKYNPVAGTSGIKVEGIRTKLLSCIIDGSQDGGLYLLPSTDVQIANMMVDNTGLTTNVAALRLGNGAGTISGLRINGLQISNSTTGINQDATVTMTDCVIEGVQFKNVTTKVSGSPPFNEERQLSAAPSTGTWRVGDRVWSSAPAAAGTMGWVCTTGGTPGTWKTFGAISA